MTTTPSERLRVLIANEQAAPRGPIAEGLTELGHDVIAHEHDPDVVSDVIAREEPDVALVGLGDSEQRALELIERIVHQAACPVIAMLPDANPDFVHEAALRGVFAYIADATPAEMQGVIDITMRRFAEYHNLQGAFGRRAVIEQAKGILMARHAVNANKAFEMLRENSQKTGEKLIEVAEAIVHSHLLLAPYSAPAEHPD